MRMLRFILAFGTLCLSLSQYNYTQIWTCNASVDSQIWVSETSEPYPFAHIFLLKSFNITSKLALVLDVDDFSNSTGAKVWTYPNNTGKGGYNEQWTFSGNGQITSKMNGLCLSAAAAIAGSVVTLQTCASDPLQTWEINSTTGLIYNGGGPNICLDAGRRYAQGAMLGSILTSNVLCRLFCELFEPRTQLIPVLRPQPINRRAPRRPYPPHPALRISAAPVKLQQRCPSTWRPRHKVHRVPPRATDGVRGSVHGQCNRVHVHWVPHVVSAPPAPGVCVCGGGVGGGGRAGS